MKYIGMPFAVWQFFCTSFEKNLTAVFSISKADAKSTMANAKKKYKEITVSLQMVTNTSTVGIRE